MKKIRATTPGFRPRSSFSHSTVIALALFCLGLIQIAQAGPKYPVADDDKVTQADSVTRGPEKGRLFIVGGGRIGDDLKMKFVELAGGTDAKIVMIPTAWSGYNESTEARTKSLFESVGATNVHVYHTTDPKQADDPVFTKILEDADAIWFGGGRQWRLVDAYGGTRSEKLFRKVLERGGIIGGSSAGATIQGSFLARGDTRNNQIMVGDHQRGFSYISNIAIDQHVLARGRQFDMFDILDEFPHLLGIGIDEGTAIVVEKDSFEVMGPSFVLIYDRSFWAREGITRKTVPAENRRFYFLREGDRYDMVKRRVLN